ncbi:MAG: 50S ribosomal protein L6 [Alphaproteobacteria bacterium]|nr:50S ribosomal protein L6 [Alphaproteobacteria bacterium]
MSRVGKNPVAIPSGVDLQVAGRTIVAKGKLGQLSMSLHPDVSVTIADGKAVVAPLSAESNRGRMQWGTARNRLNALVRGVAEGFSKSLEINGVGYRAAVTGKNLTLQLGYSHDVIFPIPDDVKIVCERPTAVLISGADKQRVGEVAAKIRSFRPPEPYKGKGIKYANEQIRRKEGKKK